MSCTVYILQSQKDKRTYVGSTNNISRRLREHNQGRVKSTKSRLPLLVLFTEHFKTIQEARKREKWWKSSTGRKELKSWFLKNKTG